jgi:hypothetical protein
MVDHELKDVYFRRFLVPIIVTLLILCGIVVIIGNVPGTPAPAAAFNQIAGALKKIIR